MDADRSLPGRASDEERAPRAAPSGGATPSEPIMDRRLGPDRRAGRERRGSGDRRQQTSSKGGGDRRGGAERRGEDRRQGDRRTPERKGPTEDLTPAVLEFVDAVRRYRDVHGGRFPTASEILQILTEELGYEKRG